jgi:hypothetical protein
MRTVVQAQPNPVTYRKVDGTVMVIILLFGDLLGLFQPETGILQKLLMLSQCLRHSNNPNFAGVIRAHGRRITAINQLEGSLLECCVEGSIVDVFSPWQPA